MKFESLVKKSKNSFFPHFFFSVVEDLIDMFGSGCFLACASDCLGVSWGQVLVILGV
jgi:hypothetical protein